jgi:hypothetical protein
MTHNFKDRIGYRSGDLEIVADAGRTDDRQRLWKAKCRRVRADDSVCNGTRIITTTQLDEVVCCVNCALMGKKGQRRGARKYKFTEAQDEMIRRIYQERRGNGATKNGLPTNKQYARRLGVPAHAIAARARQLELVIPQKDPPWSDREQKFLQKNAWMTPPMIHKRMLKRGFKRTLTAVTLKYKRLRLYSRREWLNARELSAATGEDTHKILEWVASGKLQAQKREYEVAKFNPGNNRQHEWVFTHKAIRKFVFAHSELIDLRKVDQLWFWDIIKNKS